MRHTRCRYCGRPIERDDSHQWVHVEAHPATPEEETR